MKTPVILNLVWAGVAGAAFYTGMKINGSDDSKNGASKNISVANPVAGSGPSKLVNPLMVSKEKAILDFYKQYGLDSGVPLSPEKMKEAIQAAIREGDPVKSQMMFARLMEELTPENATVALAMIRASGGGFETMTYMRMLTSKWGEVDPLNAMKELAKTDGGGGGRFGGMSQAGVLSGWASADPKAAIAWLQAYEGDDREKGFMSMSLINGLARSSPEEAVKYASALENKGDRTRAADTIAKEMIRSGGIEKATAWVDGITDPDMKRGAFQTIADQMLRSDPAKAAEYIKAHSNDEYASGAVANLANSLAKKDLQQGLDFAAGLTGEGQAKAYGSVISEWLDKDRGAGVADAAKFVEGLPAGASKDAGARELARQAMRQDPTTAIAWASSIQDPQSREETMIEAGRRFYRTDQQDAAAWLATSGLSEDAQKQITNPEFGGRGDWGGGGGPGGFTGGGGGFPGGGRGGFTGGGAARTNGAAAPATGGTGGRGRGAGGGGRGRTR